MKQRHARPTCISPSYMNGDQDWKERLETRRRKTDGSAIDGQRDKDEKEEKEMCEEDEEEYSRMPRRELTTFVLTNSSSA